MFIFYYFLTIYVGWLFYLAIMALKAANDAKILTSTTKYLAYPAVGVGYLFDIFVLNFVIGTILFAELPKITRKEFTLTARLSRLNDKNSWRGKVATWICKNMLDPFQVGGHCE